MGWNDARTRRIPNYLTLSCALAGLGYQLGFHGLHGLTDGLLGMVLGFGLLILFYLKGGMGAGDVKALAALGTWLGVWGTIYLFVYMAFAGAVLVTLVLWWQGVLWSRIKRGLGFLAERLLCVPSPAPTTRRCPRPRKNRGSSLRGSHGHRDGDHLLARFWGLSQPAAAPTLAALISEHTRSPGR